MKPTTPYCCQSTTIDADDGNGTKGDNAHMAGTAINKLKASSLSEITQKRKTPSTHY